MPRLCEEMLLDKLVVGTEKDAEVWVTMVPAHYHKAWKVFIYDPVPFAPAFMSEGDMAGAAFSVLGWESGLDLD
jgi:hypothetical protein